MVTGFRPTPFIHHSWPSVSSFQSSPPASTFQTWSLVTGHYISPSLSVVLVCLHQLPWSLVIDLYTLQSWPPVSGFPPLNSGPATTWPPEAWPTMEPVSYWLLLCVSSSCFYFPVSTLLRFWRIYSVLKSCKIDTLSPLAIDWAYPNDPYKYIKILSYTNTHTHIRMSLDCENPLFTLYPLDRFSFNLGL